MASLGGQISFPVPFNILPGLSLIPSGDVFLGDEGPDWQFNLDGAVRARPAIYAGGGLAVVRNQFAADSAATTELGYNFLAGLSLPFGLPVIPFIEARWTFVEDLTPFHLVVGINYPLGGTPSGPRRPRPWGGR